jgi:hypothetical protein
LNPGDGFYAIVLTRKTESAKNGAKNLHWTAGIANVRVKQYDSFESYLKTQSRFLDNLLVNVRLQGAAVYYFLLLATLLFLLFVSLVQLYQARPKLGLPGLALLALIFVLSVGASEVIIDAYYNNTEQAPIAWVVLGAYFVSLGATALYLRRTRRAAKDVLQ